MHTWQVNKIVQYIIILCYISLYKKKIWSFYSLYYAACFETNQQFYLSFFSEILPWWKYSN